MTRNECWPCAFILIEPKKMQKENDEFHPKELWFDSLTMDDSFPKKESTKKKCYWKQKSEVRREKKKKEEKKKWFRIRTELFWYKENRIPKWQNNNKKREKFIVMNMPLDTRNCINSNSNRNSIFASCFSFWGCLFQRYCSLASISVKKAQTKNSMK